MKKFMLLTLINGLVFIGYCAYGIVSQPSAVFHVRVTYKPITATQPVISDSEIQQDIEYGLSQDTNASLLPVPTVEVH